MILAADIGGTKTLLAVFDPKDKTFKALRKKRFINVHYNSLVEIIAEFMGQGQEIIETACLGIAGPIEDGVCRATNLPWVIESKKIQAQFRFTKVVLINDLEANAYGIEVLEPKDLYVLRKARGIESANRALISAGTGLGQAPIFYDGKRYIPSASEGGHTDFAPRNENEIELLRYLKKKYEGHVSYERVLSGMGIVNLYDFLIKSGRAKESQEVKQAMEGENQAEIITGFARTKKCSTCVECINWFCSIYGAEAGNLALKTLCMGGLYIGGGIAPKLLEILEKSAFLTSFSNKGRFAKLLEQIPVVVILRDDTALLGAALKAHQTL